MESNPMLCQIKNVRRSRVAREAFTLIELLLVLVILGVLAAVVVPKFTGKTEQARIGGAKASVSNLSTSLNNFEVDCGRFPTTEEGLNALLAAPASATGWHGPYIEATALKDPWEQPFNYVCPGTHNPNSFDLFSSGPDKQSGTQDDIGNWPAESQ
jgi:general secretion pathway protein G